ncbi:MAG: PqqD family protein [Lachnospiraceae bacterium]|nr:PqqD family protein [Lachnospiraceae bacterium]
MIGNRRYKMKMQENYLERIPVINNNIIWYVKDNLVVVEIENEGIFNRVFQKFFGKPKTTYIHIDEIGSFVWLLVDGNKNLITIGRLVEEKFDEKSKPLYERLSLYFETLLNGGLIRWGGTKF